MVMVCQNCFPEKPDGFTLDGYLKENLDILSNNIVKDNDFVILVSGNGKVRIGKSVIAMQIGYYLTQQINEKNKLNNTFTTENYAFRGADLIKKAQNMPKYSVMVYDEAGSDLIGRKVMQQTTQAVLDFFREAGQLNLFLILVLPDFFELPKSIAITRSIMLVDVCYKEKFDRGMFRLFGWKKKKLLYLLGKKFLDYDAVKPDSFGAFTNFYTINEEIYRALKYEALTGRKKEEIDRKNLRELKANSQRNAVTYWAIDLMKLRQRDLARFLNITDENVSQWRNQHIKNFGELGDNSIKS